MTHLDDSVTFRLTKGEKRALHALAARRSADMAERGDVPDDTTTGLLRALIRREAKAAGIDVDGAAAPPPVRHPRP